MARKITLVLTKTFQKTIEVSDQEYNILYDIMNSEDNELGYELAEVFCQDFEKEIKENPLKFLPYYSDTTTFYDTETDDILCELE